MIELGSHQIGEQRSFETATPLETPALQGDLFIRYANYDERDAAGPQPALVDLIQSDGPEFEPAYRLSGARQEGQSHPCADGVLCRITQALPSQSRCDMLAELLAEAWRQPVEVWHVDERATTGDTMIVASLRCYQRPGWIEPEADAPSGSAFDLFGLRLAEAV